MSADPLDKFKDATAATLRAIAKRPDIEVQFFASETSARLTPIIGITARLPLPERDMPALNKQDIRASADIHSLKLRHSNDKLHRRLRPKDFSSASLFDSLEQARVEALGIKAMIGVAKNLASALKLRCKSYSHLNAQDRLQTDAAEALYILSRLAFTGEDLPEGAHNLAALWHPYIIEKLGKNGFKNLEANLNNQREFARAARNFIEKLNSIPPSSEPERADESDDTQHSSDDLNPREDQKEEKEKQLSEGSDTQEISDDSSTHETDIDFENDDISDENPSMMEGEKPQNAPPRKPNSHYVPGPDSRYTIYTTAYDEILEAQDLADQDELNKLRAQLDKQVAPHMTMVTRLANRLQRQLMAKQLRQWQFDMDEGIIDASRLARVIANPNMPLSYKQEQQTDFRDTIVTLLIDNSGSMRGRPIALAAMSTEIIARTLERCGVKVEILGFTTRAWKGGKARELWVQNNRPESPGRLNDLRHIIYKDADEPWRRTKRNLGLMLKEGLLKENIDGEAVVWSYNRIVRRPEKRKIMMVISDGAPVDDSTLSTNSSNILEHDLQNVIQWIEESSTVEIAAIGIGHDVSRYYSRALTITDAGELAQALLLRLSELFEERPFSRGDRNRK